MENGHKKKGSFAGMILVIVLAAVLLCFMPKIRSLLQAHLHTQQKKRRDEAERNAESVGYAVCDILAP